MEPTTFDNLKALIKYADDLIDGYDTISFDLFDTLFIRRIHDPDMVKPAVARYISSLAASMGIEIAWDKVQALRDQYETEQRAETGRKFDDHEARYPDYMHRALAEIFRERMTDDLLEEVTSYELKIEAAMIVPRARLLSWIQKLFSRGKKILIVSDIYLPSHHLKRLLDHFGIMPYVLDVVSSADTFLAKASGRAFPMLADRFGLEKSRWMHIGDNPFSDGLRPAEYGIRALLIADRREKYRKTVARVHTVFSRMRLFWKGRLVQQLMLPLEGENSPKPPLYVEGYNFFAPLIGAFTVGIAEKMREIGIGHVFFFSREGLTFKKFWDRAMPFLAPSSRIPVAHYLYVSRMALAGASCAYQGLSQTKADFAFLPAGNRDMRDLCRVFSLDIEPLRPFMEKFGLRVDDPLSSLHKGWSGEIRYRFVYLLEDKGFQDEVKRQTRPYNDALQRYLEKEHFFEQRDVALVDVGWMGTIQRFLYDAVKHREDKPRFHGYLFAASRGIPYPTEADNTIEGVIYDRDHFDFAASTVMYNRDLFEEAFRAPYPTLQGYRLKEDGFELVFRTTEDATGKAEKSQDRYFAPLQQGIFDAASRFGAAMAIAGFSFEDLKPWARYLLVSKIAFPKAGEVEALKNRAHVDDIHGGHKLSKKQQKSQKHLWDYPISTLKWNPFIRITHYLKKNRPV